MDSEVSRRDLIAAMAAAGLVAACSGSSSSPSATMADPAAAAAAAKGQALAHGEMDRWAALVGTTFTATGFRLIVAGVQALPSLGARPADVTRAAAFVALFDVTAGGAMPGDLIYAMSAPGIGPLDVFLSAAPTPEFPARMLAVFN